MAKTCHHGTRGVHVKGYTKTVCMKAPKVSKKRAKRIPKFKGKHKRFK